MNVLGTPETMTSQFITPGPLPGLGLIETPAAAVTQIVNVQVQVNMPTSLPSPTYTQI